jgi:lipoprotein-anchoring transpeptidase ErfK/SrfK
VNVVKTSIHRGSKGIAVRVFQSRLASLGYVVPRNGNFDAATGRAFMAYRKVSGMARKESASSRIATRLAAGKGKYHLRHPKAGRHIEVSIRRQIMVFADKGEVQRIYHVSTGAPSTPTVRGTYRVYRKDHGTNAKGMVHSSYFIRGYAIHGFSSVPTYNASHGCVRVPVPNAQSIFDWVRLGTRVDVYF